jgi:hypothetical protein
MDPASLMADLFNMVGSPLEYSEVHGYATPQGGTEYPSVEDVFPPMQVLCGP